MSSMKGKDVLVVDDAADVRLLARKILEADGAQVFEAESVDSAIEIARHKVPQLIILDLGLPGKTGFDFLNERQAISEIRNVPVIILSGKKDKASVTQAISLGATDYIVKPFRATVVLQKARKAMKLTSFLSKKLIGEDRAAVVVSLDADITKISEAGCQMEAVVKLAADSRVSLSGELIERLGLEGVTMKVGKSDGRFLDQGRYANEVIFAGVDDELARRVRNLLKGIK